MKLIDILNQSYKDKSIDEALTKKGSTVDDQDKQSRIRYDLLVNYPTLKGKASKEVSKAHFNY